MLVYCISEANMHPRRKQRLGLNCMRKSISMFKHFRTKHWVDHTVGVYFSHCYGDTRICKFWKMPWVSIERKGQEGHSFAGMLCFSLPTVQLDISWNSECQTIDATGYSVALCFHDFESFWPCDSYLTCVLSVVLDSSFILILRTVLFGWKIAITLLSQTISIWIVPLDQHGSVLFNMEPSANRHRTIAYACILIEAARPSLAWNAVIR